MANKTESKAQHGQSKVVLWDGIKVNPPKQLNVSPTAIIPTSIACLEKFLDLSFLIRLANGHRVSEVN